MPYHTFLLWLTLLPLRYTLSVALADKCCFTVCLLVLGTVRHLDMRLVVYVCVIMFKVYYILLLSCIIDLILSQFWSSFLSSPLAQLMSTFKFYPSDERIAHSYALMMRPLPLGAAHCSHLEDNLLQLCIELLGTG